MDIRILAIGRAGKSAESELCADYLERSLRAGRQFGLQNLSIQELDERKIDGREGGSQALQSALGSEKFWLLDERGRTMSSPDFSKTLARARDDGVGRINFVIGGADGVSDAFRASATRLLSFGPMVWPHMLARVMLSEQIYRAVSIWGHSPYHRY